MKKILILGPQGSGKGTQAVRIAQKLHIPALSMGQLLREEMSSGSELGEEIGRLVNAGQLVSDEVALDVLKKRLEKPDCEHGYILDGYPRNKKQMEVFKTFDVPTDVLVIDVPKDVSLDRLMLRAEVEGRADDTPELIQKRLSIYHEETEPVIEAYKKEGVARFIDGVGTMEEVEERIDLILEV